MKALILSLFFIIVFTQCGGPRTETETTSETEQPETTEQPAADDPMANKGIGPITSLELGEIDLEMAAEGEKVYNQYCNACHKPYEKFIGPAPAGILERRSPEWIMNMILNPEEMVQKDPIAQALLIEYNMAPMANQNLTEEEARKVLEYFRTLE